MDYEKMTINDLLFHVADPFDSHDKLDSDDIEIVNVSLFEKFQKGHAALEKFVTDFYRHQGYKKMSDSRIRNEFDLLHIMNGGKILENGKETEIVFPRKTQKDCDIAVANWQRKSIKKSQLALLNKDDTYVVGKGLREFRQFERDRNIVFVAEENTCKERRSKKKKIERDIGNYSSLMKYPLNCGHVLVQKLRRDEDMLRYVIYRIKNGERIVEKFCMKVCNEIKRIEEEQKWKFKSYIPKIGRETIYKNFNPENVAIDDLFGAKIVSHGATRRDSENVNLILEASENKGLKISEEKMSEREKEKCRHAKYQLGATKNISEISGLLIPETIQIISTTLVNKLYVDFFGPDRHTLFYIKRKKYLDELIESCRNPLNVMGIVDKVKSRLNRLSFYNC